jgi:hypothetical protein
MSITSLVAELRNVPQFVWDFLDDVVAKRVNVLGPDCRSAGHIVVEDNMGWVKDDFDDMLVRLTDYGWVAYSWHQDQLKQEANGQALPTASSEPEWSEAKAPKEWRKELRIAPTTLRRYAENGTLVVHRLNKKLWQIRLDTLRRLKRDK